MLSYRIFSFADYSIHLGIDAESSYINTIDLKFTNHTDMNCLFLSPSVFINIGFNQTYVSLFFKYYRLIGNQDSLNANSDLFQDVNYHLGSVSINDNPGYQIGAVVTNLFNFNLVYSYCSVSNIAAFNYMPADYWGLGELNGFFNLPFEFHQIGLFYSFNWDKFLNFTAGLDTFFLNIKPGKFYYQAGITALSPDFSYYQETSPLFYIIYFPKIKFDIQLDNFALSYSFSQIIPQLIQTIAPVQQNTGNGTVINQSSSQKTDQYYGGGFHCVTMSYFY